MSSLDNWFVVKENGRVSCPGCGKSYAPRWIKRHCLGDCPEYELWLDMQNQSTQYLENVLEAFSADDCTLPSLDGAPSRYILPNDLSSGSPMPQPSPPRTPERSPKRLKTRAATKRAFQDVHRKFIPEAVETPTDDESEVSAIKTACPGMDYDEWYNRDDDSISTCPPLEVNMPEMGTEEHSEVLKERRLQKDKELQVLEERAASLRGQNNLDDTLSVCPEDFLGTVLNIPVNDPMYDGQKLSNDMLSILVLMHKCDSYGLPRKFLDEILDLLRQEIRERNFDISFAPTTESVRKKVLEIYGKERTPEVVTLTDSGLEKIRTDNTLTVQPEAETFYDAKCLDTRDRDAIHFSKFCVRSAVEDLLNSRKIFGDLNNLVVNPEDRWKPYVSPPNVRDEALDGTAYRNIVQRWKEMGIFDEEVDFILPLILYLDKTGTDVYQRYPLEPIILTLALIRRLLRLHSIAWRIVAFLPDLERKSSAAHAVARKSNPAHKASRYHLCLKHVFKGLAELEKEGMIVWMRLGDQVKKVRVRCPILYIIQDGKSKDMLTNRKSVYSKCARISAACKTPHASCDDPLHKCDFLLAQEIDDKVESSVQDVAELNDLKSLPKAKEQWVNEERRKKIGELRERIKKTDDMLHMQLTAHRILSGILEAGVKFGYDPFGIFGCCPTDLMHAFQSGIIPYLVKGIINQLTDTKKKELDDLVDRLLGRLKSGEKVDYPKFSFAKQYTNLTLLTSDEWPGMLFALLLVLRTDAGDRIFENVFSEEDLFGGSNPLKGKAGAILKKVRQLDGTEKQAVTTEDVDEDKEREENEEEANEDDVFARKCSKNDFILLAEALLGFHAWYKLGFPYNNWNQEQAEESIRKLMALVLLYVPRKTGHGWKLQKFHDLLHVARDIDRFGSAANYDAGPGESMLKVFAKLYAMTAQKCGYLIFFRQVSSRAHEFEAIQNAMFEHDLGIDLQGLVERKKEEERVRRQRMMTPGNTQHRLAEAKKRKEQIPPALGGAFYYVIAPGQSISTSMVNPHPGLVDPIVERFLSEQKNVEVFPPQEGLLRLLNGKKEWCKFWKIYTECKVQTNDGSSMLRCHRNYRSQGKPYHDWVMVDYQTAAEKRRGAEEEPWGFPKGLFPSKCLGFVAHPNKPRSVQVIIHSTQWREANDHKLRDTVITSTWFTQWEKKQRFSVQKGQAVWRYEPILQVAGVEAIAHRVLVMEEYSTLLESAMMTTNRIKMKKKENTILYLDDDKECALNAVVLVKKRGMWFDSFV